MVKTLKAVQHTDVNWSYSKLYNQSQRKLAHSLLTSFTGEIITQKNKVPQTGFFFNLLTKQNNQPYRVTLHGVPLQVLDPSTEHYQKLTRIQDFLTKPFELNISDNETGIIKPYTFQYVKGYMNSMAITETVDIAVPSGWLAKYKDKTKSVRATKNRKRRKKD